MDTAAVVRACLISLLEGAMIFGVFHGDLHGGNLFIQRTAGWPCSTTGSPDASSRPAGLVFLRMLLAAMVGDHRSVLPATSSWGPSPPTADLDAFLADIPVDRPPLDPGEVDADQMIAEMRRVTKALVRYGTRLPKELMLFMKDFLFIDAAMTPSPRTSTWCPRCSTSASTSCRARSPDRGGDRARPAGGAARPVLVGGLDGGWRRHGRSSPTASSRPSGRGSG